MTLLNVIIVMGVIAAGAMTMSQLSTQSARSMKDANIRMDWDEQVARIATILNNHKTCKYAINHSNEDGTPLKFTRGQSIDWGAMMADASTMVAMANLNSKLKDDHAKREEKKKKLAELKTKLGKGGASVRVHANGGDDDDSLLEDGRMAGDVLKGAIDGHAVSPTDGKKDFVTGLSDSDELRLLYATTDITKMFITIDKTGDPTELADPDGVLPSLRAYPATLTIQGTKTGFASSVSAGDSNLRQSTVPFMVMTDPDSQVIVSCYGAALKPDYPTAASDMIDLCEANPSLPQCTTFLASLGQANSVALNAGKTQGVQTVNQGSNAPGSGGFCHSFKSRLHISKWYEVAKVNLSSFFPKYQSLVDLEPKILPDPTIGMSSPAISMAAPAAAAGLTAGAVSAGAVGGVVSMGANSTTLSTTSPAFLKTAAVRTSALSALESLYTQSPNRYKTLIHYMPLWCSLRVCQRYPFICSLHRLTAVSTHKFIVNEALVTNPTELAKRWNPGDGFANPAANVSNVTTGAISNGAISNGAISGAITGGSRGLAGGAAAGGMVVGP